MKRHQPLLRISAYVLALSCMVSAARAVETTGSFLKIPVDARSVALGDGIMALEGGASSISGNPAGMGRLGERELSLLYSPYVQGMNLGFLSYAHPSGIGTFGLSILTLRSGGIDGRDDAGNPTGGFRVEDRALGLSFARGVLPSDSHPAGVLLMGGTFKYIQSSIASYSASGYAADLGLQAPVAAGRFPISAGVAVRNLGPAMRFLDQAEALPLNVGVGLSVRVFSGLAISAGATEFIHGGQRRFALGTEFSALPGLFVRGAYGMSRSSYGLSGTNPNLSGGVGFSVSRYQLNYAFTPMGELGSAHRFDVTFKFGSKKEAAPERKPNIFTGPHN